MTVLVYNTEQDRSRVATICLFLQSLAIAFSDVIVDALMCIQARRYKDGAEDLQTLSWSCLSIGGLAGSIAAAFLTENYNPAICFQVSAVFGLIIAFFAFRLDVALETEGIIVNRNSSFCNDLRRYISEIG